MSFGALVGFMTPIPSPQPPAKQATPKECKHPRVQVASRDEDGEYVVSLDCRDIFDSSEFRDMRIEETNLRDQL